jgi:phospholipid/cholesterol/gamma-HCH transport system substrate-binding protein
MRTLPPVLESARDASHSVHEIGDALDPVARHLHDAGPKLSDALDELPGVSKDLRGLLPYLDKALDRAPDTLTRVPDFSDVTNDLIPQAKSDLRDLNPLLGYLKPYSKVLATVLPNFGQTLAHGDANGRYLRTLLYVNNDTL